MSLSSTEFSPLLLGGRSSLTSCRRTLSTSTVVTTRDGLIHPEAHRKSNFNTLLRDVIIGFSDGLTVPFALTASLSTLGSTRLVIMGGLAELFSGAISMGLGAYLAALTERQHYHAEYARELREVEEVSGEERAGVVDILGVYGISPSAAHAVLDDLVKDKEQWVRFMMDFKLRLEEPSGGLAWQSGTMMGMSYFVGGLVPMVPYFLMEQTAKALSWSVGITVFILLGFGYLKNWVTIRTGRAGIEGAAHTLAIGMLAAGTSYIIVRLLDGGK